MRSETWLLLWQDGWMFGVVRRLGKRCRRPLTHMTSFKRTGSSLDMLLDFLHTTAPFLFVAPFASGSFSRTIFLRGNSTLAQLLTTTFLASSISWTCKGLIFLSSFCNVLHSSATFFSCFLLAAGVAKRVLKRSIHTTNLSKGKPWWETAQISSRCHGLANLWDLQRKSWLLLRLHGRPTLLVSPQRESWASVPAIYLKRRLQLEDLEKHRFAGLAFVPTYLHYDDDDCSRIAETRLATNVLVSSLFVGDVA